MEIVLFMMVVVKRTPHGVGDDDGVLFFRGGIMRTTESSHPLWRRKGSSIFRRLKKHSKLCVC
jgi:hypothetical protein